MRKTNKKLTLSTTTVRALHDATLAGPAGASHLIPTVVACSNDEVCRPTVIRCYSQRSLCPGNC